mmetsp:Transcript_96997/g.202679  ORF Transcript_96997/g.202679 Transcript_96997/m.202679 type:complete len:524 (-) Transcript_96997:25-1596(-)
MPIAPKSQVGEGAFSKVYLLEIGSLRGVQKEPKNTDSERAIRREAELLLTLQHGNVLVVRGMYQGMPLFQYCEGGDLFRIIEEKRRLSQSLYLRYAKGIAAAVDYIHRHQIIHRDIKCENLFADWRQEAILGDFGVFQYESIGGFSQVGTEIYWAPEVRAGSKFTRAADIWAYGMVFVNRLWPEVDVLAIDPQFSPVAEDTLNRCLNECPCNRPQATELAAVIAKANQIQVDTWLGDLDETTEDLEEDWTEEEWNSEGNAWDWQGEHGWNTWNHGWEPPNHGQQEEERPWNGVCDEILYQHGDDGRGAWDGRWEGRWDEPQEVEVVAAQLQAQAEHELCYYEEPPWERRWGEEAAAPQIDHGRMPWEQRWGEEEEVQEEAPIHPGLGGRAWGDDDRREEAPRGQARYNRWAVPIGGGNREAQCEETWQEGPDQWEVWGGQWEGERWEEQRRLRNDVNDRWGDVPDHCDAPHHGENVGPPWNERWEDTPNDHAHVQRRWNRCSEDPNHFRDGERAWNQGANNNR